MKRPERVPQTDSICPYKEKWVEEVLNRQALAEVEDRPSSHPDDVYWKRKKKKDPRKKK